MHSSISVGKSITFGLGEGEHMYSGTTIILEFVVLEGVLEFVNNDVKSYGDDTATILNLYNAVVDVQNKQCVQD